MKPREPDLFDQPIERPMVRSEDRSYARAAAETVRAKLGKIQLEVIAAYRRHGPMSSKTAEALPEFDRYGRSTVQKRISELFLAGVLEYVPDADEALYRLNEERVERPLEQPVRPRCPTCGQLTRRATSGG